MRRTARGLAAFGEHIEVTLTSPLVRARQTADILAGAFAPPSSVVVVDALGPGGTQTGILAEVAKHARKGSVALVGHEPGIGELAAHLLGMVHPLEFKKGAVARIDVSGLSVASPDSPRITAALRWFLPPRALRGLRR
jgi:phosphohistidine phosphatase